MTIRQNPFTSHRIPTARQTEFLTRPEREVLYGGAAGGGKSEGLLFAAAQFVEVPGYAALLLRRTFADLALPGALMDRAKTWWHGTAAKAKDGGRLWEFPSGATISFGYLEHEDDKYRYASSEFQMIGLDELTQFTETQATFMFSRLRRLANSNVPLRMRSGTNPIGSGREWVKKRFVPDEAFHVDEREYFSRVWKATENRAFVPAKLEDNPNLDIGEYDEALAMLDPVTRAQLRRGDWKAHAGGRFDPRWWRRYDDLGDSFRLRDTGEVIGKKHFSRATTIDPAASKKKTSKYTAIVTGAEDRNGRVLILDVDRRQLGVNEIIPALSFAASRYRPAWTGIEANGFQIALVSEARDKQRWPKIPVVHEFTPEGKSKLVRATPAILKAEAGEVYLPMSAAWLDDFEAELSNFTGDDKEDSYTDQVDAFAYLIAGFDRFRCSGAVPKAGVVRRW